MPKRKPSSGSKRQAFAIPRRLLGNSVAQSARTVEGQLGAHTHDRLLFVTDGVKAFMMTQRPIPGEDSTLWSMGDPYETAPSAALWGRAKWQLHILFTLYNESAYTLSVFDLHSHVYLVTGVERPLAMMIHRARIGLTQDNSLLSSGKTIVIGPHEAEAIDLVVETSLFDTLSTTIAFGLYVDYRWLRPDDSGPARIPSDNIYLFQHWAKSFDKCHFVPRNPNTIRDRLTQDSKNEELRQFCGELQAIYDLHACSASLTTPPDAEQERRAELFLRGEDTEPISIPEPRADFLFEFEDLVKACPSAANLLRMLAFFAPSSALPRQLIAEAHYQLSLALYRGLHSNARKREDTDEASNPEIPDCLVAELSGRAEHPDLYWQVHALRDGFKNRNLAVRALIERRLLTRHDDAMLINMPAHICAQTLEHMDAAEKRVFGQCAFYALETLVPTRESSQVNEPLSNELVPHAKACLDCLRHLEVRVPETDTFVHNFADYLLHSRNYVDGEIFWSLAVASAEELVRSVEAESRFAVPKELLSKCNLVLALDLGYLAETLRLGGKPEAAEPVMLRAVGLYDNHGRPEKEQDRLISLHNLGLIYRDLGRFEEAKSMLSRVVPQLELVASPEQFSEALEDFGNLLSSMGDGTQSDVMLRRAREIRERRRAIF